MNPEAPSRIATGSSTARFCLSLAARSVLPRFSICRSLRTIQRPGIFVFQADDQIDPLLTADLPQVGQGHSHPIDVVVKGDTNVGETSLRIPKSFREFRDPFPEPFRFSPPVADHPETERLQGLHELCAERHGEFGRRRGSRGPEICGEIGDGEVRLMADSRDDGDPRAGNRPGDTFVVERGEVFQ